MWCVDHACAVSAMIEALFSGTSVTPCWVVGAGEEQQYRSAGASVVHEGGKLCPSRNTALSLAQTAGKICVQCSDDISTCVFKQLADEWTAGAAPSHAGAAGAGLSPDSAAELVALLPQIGQEMRETAEAALLTGAVQVESTADFVDLFTGAGAESV